MKDSAAETSGVEEGESHTLGKGEKQQQQHTNTNMHTHRSVDFVERMV